MGIGRTIPALLLLPLVAGCLSVSYDRAREGTGREYVDSAKLEPGKHTLGNVLDILGPPQLILRAGEVDRAYYLSSDVEFWNIAIGIPFTVGGNDASADIFGLGLGSEEFLMVRLEFDRASILRDLQRARFESSHDGEAIGVDSRIVSLFLEDRTRSLRLREEDDDDEDVELDPARDP